jgi:hypothetical protein
MLRSNGLFGLIGDGPTLLFCIFVIPDTLVYPASLAVKLAISGTLPPRSYGGFLVL